MVDRVVFDVELGNPDLLCEPRRSHERREARVEPGPRLADDRQQLAITPEILGPAFDDVAGQVDLRVVVDGFERTEAALAGISRVGRKRGLAQMTLQADERTD